MASIPLPALHVNPPADPLDSINKAMSLRSLMQGQRLQGQQIQENQLRISTEQKQQQDLQKISQAYMQANGDLDKTADLAAKAGVNPETIVKLKNTAVESKQKLLTLDASQRAAMKSQAEMIGQHSQAILGLPPEQRAAATQQSIQQLTQAGAIPQDQAQQLLQSIPQDPQALDQWLKVHSVAAMSTKDQIDQVDKEQVRSETMRHNKATEATAGGVEGRELKDYLADSSIDAGKNKNAATFAQWKARQSPSAVILNNQLGGGGEGTPLRQAAQRYLQSGELPSGFARSPGTMTAILKEANAIDPNANIAGNKAIYGANKKALGDLQDQFSKVTAFENTAIKNLDQVLATGKQIPDLGARFANTPVRAISEKMIGTPAMAKFKAALVTAQTEAAKVLNSATGSGVLSDSARHELEGLLSGSLPYPAMEAAINQLKTDMGNRHQSYQDEIGNLQQAVGGSPTQAPASNSGNPFAQFGGKPR